MQKHLQKATAVIQYPSTASSRINTFVLLKNYCARLTLTHTHTQFLRPGESVNRSKSDFADLGESNNQPVQLHKNAQKIWQGKSISEAINLYLALCSLENQQANVLQFFSRVFRNHQSSSFRFCGAGSSVCPLHRNAKDYIFGIVGVKMSLYLLEKSIEICPQSTGGAHPGQVAKCVIFLKSDWIN